MDRRIRAELLVEYVRYRRPLLILTHSVASLIIAYVMWNIAERWTMVAFPLAVNGATLATLGLRHACVMDMDARRRYDIWERRFVIAMIAVGGAWGLGTLATFIGPPNFERALMLGTLAGLSAGVCSGHATQIRVVYAFLVPALAPLFAYGLYVGDPMHLTLAAMLVFFAVTMLYYVHRTHGFHRRMIRQALELEAMTNRLRNAQQRTEAALMEAQESNEAKSRFLASMTHELRTPLNAIIGFSELIRDELLGPVGNSKYREYAGDIYNSGNLLLEMISDVLDTAKIEAGRYELDETEIVPVDVARDVMRLIQPRAEKARISLDLTDETDGTPLWLDARALRQMLLNLVSNSVKFTPAGGQISLRIHREGRGLAVGVRDTGIGIAAEDVPVVLEPFGQVRSAQQREHSGTGLGLPLTRSIMELHDGRLTVISEPGLGTTITLHFPQERVKSPRPTAVPSRDRAADHPAARTPARPARGAAAPRPDRDDASLNTKSR